MATAVENKERKKLAMRIGAAVVFLLIIVAAYFLLTGGDEEEVQTTLGESDSMVPQDPAQLAADGADAIRVYPEVIALQPGNPVTIFQIQSGGVPLLINDVRFPQEFKSDISVSNIDCPANPVALQPGASCQVEVRWLSGRAISTTVEVVAESAPLNSTGTTPISKMIPITAATADPNIANAAGAPSATGPNGMPIDGTIPPQTANGGSQPMPAQPSPASYPASYPEPQMVGPAPQSLREQQRSAYISQRRSGQMTTIQPSGQLSPSARSPYTSWNNIGVTGQQSSLPTDMSRVLTPDKPITAVISYTIDTTGLAAGFTRAVAMVDRDVYGNNGRTIVIPRGSRLVGTVGGGEERVGVAWEQLIRPDGVRFVFQGTSADTQGRGGIPGRVNERLLTRYGYSLLPSFAGAGLTALLGGNQVTAVGNGGVTTPDGTNVGGSGATQVRDAKSVAAEILNQPLQQIAQDIYSRKSKIPTQIIVAAGTRITVWALDDLRLKPAGERDMPSQEGQQNGNRFTQQRDVNLEPDQAQRQNNALQPTAQNRNQAPQQQDYPEPVPVGRVDENGNYIAPGVNAPTPSTAPLNRPTRTTNRWGQ